MKRRMAVLAMAAKLRLMRLIGKPHDPFADTPTDLALSPSARHFTDYQVAPLRMRYSTLLPSDAVAWQTQAREKLAELMGYTAAESTPTVSFEDSHVLGNGLQRRRIYLHARPGVDIPIHLISSRDITTSAPVMLCLQGTNSGAHISWGEARFPADHEKHPDYAIALQAARRGYLAVAIEQSCFGERGERQIRPRSTAPCVDAFMHAVLLGRCLLGERCTDVSAVVSWLCAEAVGLGINPHRIHVMGHSAGGSVALFSAALDQRIAAVLVGGCVGGIRDTIGRRRDDQGQNVVPGILNWLDLADVVGLVAPRPLAIVAGAADSIWPASAGERVYSEAAAIYSALEAKDRLLFSSAPGGHYFRPELSWALLAAALGPAPEAVVA